MSPACEGGYVVGAVALSPILVPLGIANNVGSGGSSGPSDSRSPPWQER
ncbi:MAG: hypothetical protein Q4G49_17195 [Paracoccus sp. (in: a-proteobacteria)]|nr:hypothetical protein [Paracoccus sp. (in: a-proteobacteria)]